MKTILAAAAAVFAASIVFLSSCSPPEKNDAKSDDRNASKNGTSSSDGGYLRRMVDATKQAHRVAARKNLLTLNSALAMYAVDHGTYPASIDGDFANRHLGGMDTRKIVYRGAGLDPVTARNKLVAYQSLSGAPGRFAILIGGGGVKTVDKAGLDALLEK